MAIISQTAEIFEILSKGAFISSNSTSNDMRQLYAVIDENFDDLYEYFLSIRFILTRGDEFFYFTRNENRVDLERKLEQAMKWIDILDFFKSYDESFGPGYRFTPSDFLIRLNTDAGLRDKLTGLKKYAANKDKLEEVIDRIIDLLRKDGFIEVENEVFRSYKVTSAFNYLEQLVLSINIPEEIRNEIPE
jgi:hypothetical protein